MRSPEAIRRAARSFKDRWRNDPGYREYRKAAAKKFRARNPDYGRRIHVRFDGLKSKCRHRGIPLEIDFKAYKELVEGQLCAYCGADLSRSKGSSLDRIDSSLGYIPGNCLPCCYLCNVMKSDLSQEQFYAHIRKILECLDGPR